MPNALYDPEIQELLKDPANRLAIDNAIREANNAGNATATATMGKRTFRIKVISPFTGDTETKKRNLLTEVKRSLLTKVMSVFTRSR